jgi:hypothetical protein
MERMPLDHSPLIKCMTQRHDKFVFYVIIIFFASTIWISYVNALQQKYTDLRKKGLLTEEEFQKLKADILSQM